MVDMFQLLLILHCICGSIGSFYEVTLCEKKSLSISCDNGTEIEIQHILFGPSSSSYGENQKSVQVPTLNETEFEAACTNRSYCYLNSTEIFQLNAYPYIQRLKKHAYKCDFEYLGCYEDNVNRLFTGPGIKYGDYMPEWKQNMSALICRNFCSLQGNYPYFGTENVWECYCGIENDSKKLNTTYNGASYYWHEKQDCSSNCAQHTYEKCGRNGRISTYTTKTDRIEELLLMNEIPKKSCKFNSSIDSSYLWQVSERCEQEKQSNFAFDDCNETICWTKEFQSLEPNNLDYCFPKYMTINYTCREPRNDKTQSLASEHMSQKSNLVDGIIGTVSGFILVFGMVIVFYLVKRNRLKRKASRSPDIKTNKTFDQEIVEYENVVRDTEVPSNKNDNEKNLTYSNVMKQNGALPISTSGQENNTFSSLDDVYVETAEGMYDISNKQRDKKGSPSQAIYSHTTEDVYDNTTTHAQLEENAYDEGFHS